MNNFNTFASAQAPTTTDDHDLATAREALMNHISTAPPVTTPADTATDSNVVTLPVPTGPRTPPVTTRRNRFLAAGLVAALALGVGYATWSGSQHEPHSHNAAASAPLVQKPAVVLNQLAERTRSAQALAVPQGGSIEVVTGYIINQTENDSKQLSAQVPDGMKKATTPERSKQGTSVVTNGTRSLLIEGETEDSQQGMAISAEAPLFPAKASTKVHEVTSTTHNDAGSLTNAWHATKPFSQKAFQKTATGQPVRGQGEELVDDELKAFPFLRLSSQGNTIGRPDLYDLEWGRGEIGAKSVEDALDRGFSNQTAVAATGAESTQETRLTEALLRKVAADPHNSTSLAWTYEALASLSSVKVSQNVTAPTGQTATLLQSVVTPAAGDERPVSVRYSVWVDQNTGVPLAAREHRTAVEGSDVVHPNKSFRPAQYTQLFRYRITK